MSSPSVPTDSGAHEWCVPKSLETVYQVCPVQWIGVVEGVEPTEKIYFLEHHVGLDGMRKGQFKVVCHTLDAADIGPVPFQPADHTILGSGHHSCSKKYGDYWISLYNCLMTNYSGYGCIQFKKTYIMESGLVRGLVMSVRYPMRELRQ